MRFCRELWRSVDVLRDVLRRVAWVGVALALGCRLQAHSQASAQDGAPARAESPAAQGPIGFSNTVCKEPAIRLSSPGEGKVSVPRADVDAVVEGPIVKTTATLTVGNPTGAAEEVVAEIDLSRDAVLQDLQLDVEGQWQRSHVVGRREGRWVYDAIVAEARDPAIVEQDDPGRVALRVFPVPKGGTRRVRLTWLRPLSRDRSPVTVNLCGLPEVGVLAVHVEERGVAETWRHDAEWRHVRPRSPLVAVLAGGRAGTLVQGPWVATRIEATGRATADPLEHFTILVDSSASRRGAFAGEVDRLAEVVARIAERDPGIRVRVIAFDQSADVVFDGRVSRFRTAVVRLRDRGALGGTDLLGAIEATAGLIVGTRLVVVSDAAATLGELDLREGKKLRTKLEAAGVRRVDAVLARGGRRQLLSNIAERGGSPGRVMSGRRRAAALLHDLEHSAPVVSISARGALFISPRRWVDADGARVVFARLEPKAGWHPKLVGAKALGATKTLDGESRWVAPLVGAQLLAEIEDSMAWLPPGHPRMRTQVELATKTAAQHQLVSRYTARLALESEQQFKSSGLGHVGAAGRGTGGSESHRLEAEAKRLEAIQRKEEAAQRAYARALEAWAQTRKAGRAAGSKPKFEDFAHAEARRKHKAMHKRIHARVDKPAIGERFGRIEGLTRRGKFEVAAKAARTWATAQPDSGLPLLAGARVALASGAPERAARWLGTTFETVPAEDPMHGVGAFWVDPHTDGPHFDVLVARQESYSTERPHILRGIAALAREEPDTAAARFGLAIRAYREYERREGEPAARVPDVYGLLLAMAGAASPSASDAREIAKATGVGIHRRRGRVIVVAATSTDPKVIRVLVEGRQHRAIFENLDRDGEEHGYLEGMIGHTEVGRLERGERLLVWASPKVSEARPLVGAIYVVDHDGTGRVRVLHRPFAFTEGDASIELQL